LVAQVGMACNPVSPIKKGEPSLCDGYVFSIDKEKETASKVLELKYFKELSLIQDKLIIDYKNNYEDLYGISKDQRSELMKSYQKLASNEQSSFWRGFFYFAVGVATTTLVTFAVNDK